MRSVLNVALALAAFSQTTSAAALPGKRHYIDLNKWRYYIHGPSGTGGPETTIVSVPDTTIFSTSTITATATIIGNSGAPPAPSEGTTNGNSGVINSSLPNNSEEEIKFPTLTLPASYKPTGFYNATGSGGSPYGTISLTPTAAGPTTLPSSTLNVSSSPILPSSEAGGDSVITQTVVPIPIPEITAVSLSAVPTAAKVVATSAPATGNTPQWKPAVGSTWQIQLHGIVPDTNLPVDIYDIDLVESSPDLISTLHAANKKVICYFSAGSFESWRPDAASFASSDKGSPLIGWENEWWLNTNSANVRNIMKSRLDLAKSKGCDGVDPDNIDVYSNPNGFGISKQDSLAYLQFLSAETRARGMAMGMKNGLDMVTDILDDMDFHVNESCLEFGECDKLVPFITAGKPVFHIEYLPTAPTVAKNVADSKCKEKTEKNFSSVLKTLLLDDWVQTC